MIKIICKHCKNVWNYKGKSKYYVTCPNCYYKVKSPLRKYLNNSCKTNYLNPTEKKAFNYLIYKGIKINENKIKLHQRPDFIDNFGRGYEIKKMFYTNNGNKFITFRKNQIDNFDDKTKVLIFDTFKNIPYLECSIKDIKKAKSNVKGNKNINGINFRIR